MLREDSKTLIPVRLAYLPFTPLSNVSSSQIVKCDSIQGFLFNDWGFCTTSPFFSTGRQLFLDHYFPAYFAILLSCIVFDLLTSTLRPPVQLQIAGVLIILAILNFWHYRPLTYGGSWMTLKCEKPNMMKTWDFSW